MDMELNSNRVEEDKHDKKESVSERQSEIDSVR